MGRLLEIGLFWPENRALFAVVIWFFGQKYLTILRSEGSERKPKREQEHWMGGRKGGEEGEREREREEKRQ